MKKKEALSRLTALENETAALRKIIDTCEDKPITDRIKTYEDACNDQDIKPLDLSHFSFLPKSDQKSSFAHHQLIIIAKALNEGHIFNWSNSSEYKYYPYFKMAGFGFSGANCNDWYARTTVGSRLCFKTRELAEYAGKQFENIYKELLTQ